MSRLTGIAVHIPQLYPHAAGLRSRKHNLLKQRHRSFLISCFGVIELIHYEQLQTSDCRDALLQESEWLPCTVPTASPTTIVYVWKPANKSQVFIAVFFYYHIIYFCMTIKPYNGLIFINYRFTDKLPLLVHNICAEIYLNPPSLRLSLVSLQFLS